MAESFCYHSLWSGCHDDYCPKQHELSSHHLNRDVVDINDALENFGENVGYFCKNYIKGNCERGENCEYSHYFSAESFCNEIQQSLQSVPSGAHGGHNQRAVNSRRGGNNRRGGNTRARGGNNRRGGHRGGRKQNNERREHSYENQQQIIIAEPQSIVEYNDNTENKELQEKMKKQKKEMKKMKEKLKQKETDDKFKELEQQRKSDNDRREMVTTMKEMVEQQRRESERNMEALKFRADMEKKDLERKMEEEKFRLQMTTQLKNAEYEQKMDLLKNQMTTDINLAKNEAQSAKEQANAAAKPTVIYGGPGWGPGSNWFCHSCGTYRGNRYCPSHGSSNGYWN